ncbi:unnamed protein product [Mucor circinelloides]
MQSKAYLLFFTALIYLFVQVDAACNCSPSDTSCLQKCVTDGQQCISSCDGDNSCYNSCIENHWPGQSDSSATTTSAGTTAGTTASTTAPATTESASSETASVTTVVPSSVVVVPSGSDSVVPTTSALSSIASAASSAASSLASVSSAISSSLASASSAATFTPTPPTSSQAPEQSGAASKPLLVPAVAIGVASITVIVQFFFLARMGNMLFH